MERTELPAGWRWTTLQEIADIVGGGTPSREISEFFTGDIPWFTPSEIAKTQIKVVKESRESITEAALKRSSVRLLPPGTVLLTSRASIGYVAISGAEVTTNQGFANFIPKSEVDSHYLAYWLWSQADQFEQLATGTTFKEISKGKLRTIPFPLAPVLEQQHIVNYIETQFTRLDAAVAALKRVQANLRRYRAAVLKAACEGRLVPTEAALAQAEGRSYEPAAALLQRILAERRARWQADHPGKQYKEPEGPDTSALPALPDGWCWATVEQLSDVSGGLTKNSRRDHLPLKLPYLRVANVYANRLELDDIETIGVSKQEIPRVQLEEGDLLIVEGNGSPDQIGRVAVWNGSIPQCLHQNHLIKVRFTDKRLANHVLYWLLSRPGREYIRLVASSTSGLYTLSLSKVANLPVPLAPSEEQARIVAEIEHRLSMIEPTEDEMQGSLVRAARLRQSILQQAFSGQLLSQPSPDHHATQQLSLELP